MTEYIAWRPGVGRNSTDQKLKIIKDIAFENHLLRERNGKPSQERIGLFRTLGRRNRLGLYTVRAAAFSDGLFLSFRLPKDGRPMQFDFEYYKRWNPSKTPDPRDNIPTIECCDLVDLDGIGLLRRNGYRFIESRTIYSPDFQAIIDSALEVIQEEASPSDGSDPWRNAYTSKEILLSSYKKMQIINPNERYL